MAVKTMLQSTADSLNAGTITMRQARESLCLTGWFNYLPSEQQVTDLLNRYTV